MLVRKVTHEQILAAMARVNTDARTCMRPYAGGWGSDRAALHPVGRGYRFTLRLTDSKAPFHRRGFHHAYAGARPPKRMNAVCWHGHKAFMLALFAQQPDAVIITGMARYDGIDGFMRNHEATYERNVGSRAMPQAYGDACDCTDDSERYLDTLTPVRSHAIRRLTGDGEDLPGIDDSRVVESYGNDEPARWAEYNRKFNELLCRGKA